MNFIKTWHTCAKNKMGADTSAKHCTMEGWQREFNVTFAQANAYYTCMGNNTANEALST